MQLFICIYTAMIGTIFRRAFGTTARVSGGGPFHRTQAKDVLPFNPDQNRWALLFKFCLFCWSGSVIPFYVVTYHLRNEKKAASG